MVLWWRTNLQCGGTYTVPTNFPTHRLEIRADRTGLENHTIKIDGLWDPGRDVEIEVYSFTTATAGTNTVRLIGPNAGDAETIYTANFTGTGSRLARARFDDGEGTWRLVWLNVDASYSTLSRDWRVPRAGESTGVKRDPTGPCTVEEWLELWRERHPTPQE